MKYHYLLTLFATGCAAAHTLSPVAITPTNVSTQVVLTGAVRNARPNDTVRVTFKQAAQRVVMKAPIEADGQFRLRVPHLTAPADAQLTCGWSETIYLVPGDSLHITLDREAFMATLRFSGRGAEVNNYLTQAQRYFGYHADDLPEALPTASTVSPTEFVRLADAYRQRQLDTLGAYQARSPLPEAVVQTRQQVFELQRAVSLLNYVARRKHELKAEPMLPADYYSFLTTLPVREQPAYAAGLAQVEIQELLLESYRYARLLPADSRLPAMPGTAEKLYAQATTDFGDTPARDYLVGGLLANQLYDFAGAAQAPVRAALPAFRAYNRDSLTAQRLRQALVATAPLQRGQPAPDLQLRDANGRSVALHNFRGKVVYLDFWYSGCKPCLAEAPASILLKKQFEGREVVFVYVSVDADASLWQQTIKKYALTSPNSVHLLDTKGAKAPAAYAIGGYPSYWIIDRAGRIWRDNAPRPSAGAEAVASLEQALAAK